MIPRLSGLLALTVLLTGLFGTPPAAAQSFPGFGGIEVRLGLASPENAQLGFGATADLDLGYLAAPTLRTIVGFSYLGSDVERVDADGSFNARGGRLGLRLDPLGAARLSPFILVTANLYEGRFNLPDNPGLERALDGFNAGIGLGVGFMWALDDGHRSMAMAEVRRIFVNNLNQWGLELGLRFQPRGQDTYRSDDVIRYD